MIIWICALWPHKVALVAMIRLPSHILSGIHGVQASNVFAGKHGLITPRDLFKWAGRGAISYEQLAANGYMLLAERLRLQEERDVVQGVLERVMNVKVRSTHDSKPRMGVGVHSLVFLDPMVSSNGIGVVTKMGQVWLERMT